MICQVWSHHFQTCLIFYDEETIVSVVSVVYMGVGPLMLVDVADCNRQFRPNALALCLWGAEY